MSWLSLILRGARYHARTHLGVVLGAAIATAALAGALILGDSVRSTLRTSALARIGRAEPALNSGDRFFRADLATRLARTALSNSIPSDVRWTTALRLNGLVTMPEAGRTASRVQVLGVDPLTWPGFAGWSDSINSESWQAGRELYINEPLAAQLRAKAGDEVLVRVRKPGLLSSEAALTPKTEHAVAMRLRIGRVLTASELGSFNLHAGALAQPNAFIALPVLNEAVELTNRANLILAGPDGKNFSPVEMNKWERALRQAWALDDAGLVIRRVQGPEAAQIELASSRVFLDPPAASAAAGTNQAIQVFTYLANLIQCGSRSVSYSMVTAVADSQDDPSASRLLETDPKLKDDEILINDWLARELRADKGSEIKLSYYIVESGGNLVERTNVFAVRAIVPLAGKYADRSLMPEFPGIARAESTHDWDVGFPLRYPIRPQDEAYWKQYRGTPKAFVTLKAGQQMWGNRFGALTALRFSVPPGEPAEALAESLRAQLHDKLDPATLGLQFVDVRQPALEAASQAQDFGELFLGFSFFLVMAALLLMALLFRFALEQRMGEIGLLLAVGFGPGQVRAVLLGEGLIVALAGGVLGSITGVFYAHALLTGLRTVWNAAAGGLNLSLNVQPSALVISALSGAGIALLTIGLGLRGFTRRPARELLAGELSSSRFNKSRMAFWVALSSGLAAVGLLLAGGKAQGAFQAPVFFGAGALILICGIALSASWLGRLASGDAPALSLVRLAARGCGRRRGRSLAAIGLLACGTFMIAGPSVFRLDATDESSLQSGTGGFGLIGETAIPVVQDLNSQAGREFFNLDPGPFKGATIVPFRVREGDEASCLALTRAQRPRLLGVDPGHLKGRFTFTAPKAATWDLLRSTDDAEAAVPAIGDANAIQWALGKKIGDTIDYTDEQGRSFKVRIVGAVANSILQGSLAIDERAFRERFPSESGARFFLIATASDRAPVETALSRGLELASATERLNAFNAVQNTYLGTFQVLGGLGLLLGSAGLGIVVLRNVFERRAELAVLTAVGFSERQILFLVLAEHLVLLFGGIALGVVAAAIAVSPALSKGGQELPAVFLGGVLGAVLLNGIFWTWLAARKSLHAPLLDALRNE
jgi:ABC-type lipoprotein release transport system permease subunit